MTTYDQLNLLINKLQRIISSNISKNMSSVMLGAAIAQVLNLAAYPLLTRLYDPLSFGLLGSFVAISSVVSPLSALCFPIAIVLPKSDCASLNIARVALIVGAFSTLFYTLIIWILINTNFEIEILRVLDLLIFWMIPMILFSSWLQIVSQLLTRQQIFKLFSLCLVLQAVLVNFVKIIGGYIYGTGSFLIVSTVLGPLVFVCVFLAMKQRFKYFDYKKCKNATPSELYRTAFEFRSYPLFRTPQVALSTIVQAVPVVLLASYFGAEYVGFYILARLILDTPTNLIGRGVTSVVYPRIARNQRCEAENLKLLATATTAMFLIGLCIFGTIFFYGELIFQFVFGDNWATSGKIGESLSILAFANLLNKPCVAAIPVIKLEKWLLFFELIATIFKLTIMIIAYNIAGSALTMISSYAIASALTQLYLICKVFHTIKL